MFIVCIILLSILLIMYLLMQTGIIRRSEKKISPIGDTEMQNLTEHFKLDNVLNTKDKIFTKDEDKIINIDDTSNNSDIIAESTLEFSLIQSDNNILTSGESDYYKSLLKDKRWITLKNQKLKENSYVCQNCFNIRRLESVKELLNILPFTSNRIVNFITELFEHLPEYNFTDIFPIQERKTNFIPRYHIFMCSFMLDFKRCAEQNNFLAILVSDSLTKVLRTSFIVDREKAENEIKYRAIQYTEDSKTYDIDLFYIAGNNTNGDLYIHYNSVCLNQKYKQRVAILTKDEFVIVFPIRGIIKSIEQLEVHHLKYSKTGYPWEVTLNDLQTLCHSCHIEANKQPIPIE